MRMVTYIFGEALLPKLATLCIEYGCLHQYFIQSIYYLLIYYYN